MQAAPDWKNINPPCARVSAAMASTASSVALTFAFTTVPS